jgi:glucosamine--fructose-6-phosphate aminotransferase (isomerizing)
MCGIVAYLGNKEAYPVLIQGLRRLEYRGYDSAGVALCQQGGFHVIKTKGKVDDLEAQAKGKDVSGTVGIGHTRWATHGEPNDVNAHPHCSQSEDIVLIHNGIIENYSVLKEQLLQEGYTFCSATDTEVLVQFIDFIKKSHQVSLLSAVQIALQQVVGAYALAILSREDPDMIIAVRKGSPLVIGIGEEEFLLASDATPIVEHTQKVVYLNDEEIAVLKRGQPMQVTTIHNVPHTFKVTELEMSLSALEKEGFDHFMLKEIYEQPRTIRDSCRGRVNVAMNQLSIAGVIDHRERFMAAKRIIIMACGTSYHAGLIGEYMFEEFARIPVEVEYSSEFRYRNPLIYPDDIVIAISQSGETADTLAALEISKEKDALLFGICNVVGSSIPRNTHSGCYTHAGPEIGVASTKAFTAQVTVLALLSLAVGRLRGTLPDATFHEVIHELDQLPSKVESILEMNEELKDMARIFTYARNFLYLGRGYNFPVALEGALKLKEISYIHAEGYPAAEMKHGPIALIDAEMPVVVIATHHNNYEKIISNIQEVKARKGRIIAVVTEGDVTVRNLADFVIEVPHTVACLGPILSIIPLQMLAYHIAVVRGCNVDQPRNLAKSVTVE